MITCQRRQFLTSVFPTLVTFSLLRTVQSAQLIAGSQNEVLHGWVSELDQYCRDLRRHTLSASEWQQQIERLLSRISIAELLAYMDFERLEKKLAYPDLGVDTQRVRFPDFEPFPKGLSFHSKLFGMEQDRAIIPHGHQNMVSAHLVLGGQFHLRQFERVASERDALIVQPSVDQTVTAGHASSISDDKNNVHWLIARNGRAYTLDVIMVGLDPHRPGYAIDNLDPMRSEKLAGGRLRMPKLSVEEALQRYGRDHHFD